MGNLDPEPSLRQGFGGDVAEVERFRLIPYEPRFEAGVLEIAHELHQESVYRALPMDEHKVIAQLSGPFSQGENNYFRMVVKGDEVYGGFLGSLVRTFFGSALIARDHGWWVKRSRRGTGAAVILLADFERWAREKGASWCVIGQSSAIDMEKTVKLYSHCGYTITGFNTVKEL